MDGGRESTGGDTSALTTKRSLVVLTHAMERAFDLGEPAGTGAAAGDPDAGLVLALFQRREFFAQEAARYGDLARRGATVVVGFAATSPGPPEGLSESLLEGPSGGLPDGLTGALPESFADDLPQGVHGVVFDPEDPLALEWAVVLLRRGYGSALTAHDARQFSEGELTMQASRLFDARWTFGRAPAVTQARRLLALLAPGLPGPVVDGARAVIDTAQAVPVSDIEEQLSAAVDHLVTSLDSGHQRAVRARVELEVTRALAERDQLTGLHNRYYLERFLGPDGNDPAALAVLLVDVDDLKSVNDRFGHRAGDAVITTVARTLRAAVRTGDVVIRWGGDEFLVLAPGLSTGDALTVAEDLAAAVRRARADEPWDELPLSASIGVSVTARARLPLDALDSALSAVKSGPKGHAGVAPLAVSPR